MALWTFNAEVGFIDFSNSGKKILKVKEKLKEERLKPSDDKLRDAICETLKEVDFNTVRLSLCHSVKSVQYFCFCAEF